MHSRNRYGCPACLAVFRSGFARCPLDGAPLQVLLSDPLSGSTFEDRYVIEECVGEGGMGRVYRARHTRVSRRFAVKVLFGDRAAESKAQERFAREAEAASRLSHANVVPVVDFGETEYGVPYLVMDWVEGTGLSALIFEEAPFDRDRVIGILSQLAAGLAHAHDQGLVHRDFKSENVIVCRAGGREVPKIVDFGIAMIAREEDEGAPEQERLTTEGMVMGTPAYMAPEQATDERIDHRCDLFALGVLAYQMLSGSLPFDGRPAQMARQNMLARVPPIAERVPGLEVDPQLEAVAVKLMAKRPEDRYQDAGEVVSELESLGRQPGAPLSRGAAIAAAGPDERTEKVSFESLTLDAPEAGEGEDDPTAAGASRSRRFWTVAGAAAALASLLSAVFLLGRPETRPALMSGAIARGLAADPVPGAGELAPRGDVASDGRARSVEAVKEAPAERRSARSRRRGNRAGAGGRQGDERQDQRMSPARLQRLYERVGTEIAELHERRGVQVARRYEERYLAIPLASALQNRSLQKESYRSLVRLRRALRKELGGRGGRSAP